MALYAANVIKDGNTLKALDLFCKYGAPANPQVNFVCSVEIVKVGVHLKAVFPPLNLGLMRIFGDFWEEIVFLKGLVNFGEIRNIEDLFCF